MKAEDIEIYLSLRYDDRGFYYYIVPTSFRRSGIYKVSLSKYDKLKNQYEKYLKNNEILNKYLSWLD